MTGNITEILKYLTNITTDFNDKKIYEAMVMMSYSLSSNEVSIKYDIKKHINKRSQKANNYMWELLNELSDKLNINAVEDYKRRVKELEIFRQWEIETSNVETFKRMWTSKGVAWFIEITDTLYKDNKEYKLINAYYGSSSYNSKLMSRLIDGVVEDCKAIGIETKTPDEINKMLSMLEE